MNVYIKYGLIAISFIYVITFAERVLNGLNNDNNPTELIIEHATQKARMQTKIDFLENKLHSYEIELLKINRDVNNLSNDQLDSTWATIFK